MPSPLKRLTRKVFEHHSNPWSAWTRLLSVPLVFVPLWTRSWKHTSLVGAWLLINPVVFPAPKDDSAWATRLEARVSISTTTHECSLARALMNRRTCLCTAEIRGSNPLGSTLMQMDRTVPGSRRCWQILSAPPKPWRGSTNRRRVLDAIFLTEPYIVGTIHAGEPLAMPFQQDGRLAGRARRVRRPKYSG